MKRIKLTLPSPYVGLRPFFEREALLFFGRDAHVRDLLEKLQRRQRFLAVLGASGTGKSSLARAGLIPALRRGALLPQPTDAPASAPIDRWNTCIFTPGDAPLARLAHALTGDPRWLGGVDRSLADASLAALLGASPLALSTLYRQHAAQFEGEALLLVVDQFEEVFRYRQRNPDEADSFVKLLLRSASEDVPIYVVMTMRSDFLGHAVAIHGLAEAINSGIYLTPRLGTEQIRSVITSPLALVGGSIAPVLANRLVNTLSGEDELPVLEHALLRMWDRAKAAGRSSIEAEDYLAICGPRDGVGAPALPLAIDNHASEIHDALTPAQQAVTRQCFLALVERRDGRDVRRPQTLAELRALVGANAEPDLMAVIDAYRATGTGFVLPPASRTLQDTDLIDISHESLIRRWRQLQGWLDDEAQDVSELLEWKQRAERRLQGGGWLDANDAARAARWQARVSRHGHPAAWADRNAGTGTHEFVEHYLRESQAEVDRLLVAQEALRRAAEQAHIEILEAKASQQEEAARRAAADQAKAEQATRDAQATTRTIRFRGRIAVAVGLVAIVTSVVAGLSYRQAEQALSKAQAGELAYTAEALERDLPDTSLLLALQARQADPTSALANALIRAAEASQPYRLVLRAGPDTLITAQFAPDGRSVLTASQGAADLWDASTGSKRLALAAITKPLTSAQWSPDGKRVLSTSENGTAQLWDAASGRVLQALQDPGGSFTAAQFSPDGRLVATAGKDQALRLWRVTDGQPLPGLFQHDGAVTSLRFSSNGQQILTASDDKRARLWRVADGALLQTFTGHFLPVTVARFSPDEQTILTVSADVTAKLWDARSGKLLYTLEGHSADITDAQFSADGQLVVTAGADAEARLWKVADGKPVRSLKGHEGPLRSAVFSADGQQLLTASADKTVSLWEVASGKLLRVLRGHEEGISSASYSPDGQTILSAGGNGSARLWPVASGAMLHTLHTQDEHSAPLRGLAFAADGKTLLTAGDDATARLWDVAEGTALKVLSMRPEMALKALPASTDMALLAPAALPPPDSAFLPILSQDSKRALTLNGDNTASLWQVATGKARILKGHADTVTGAQFSPDGLTVATASGDKTVHLWQVADGSLKTVLTGHASFVMGIDFSADGKKVLTASWDKTARLWRAADGTLLRTFGDASHAVSAARLSPDGLTVLTMMSGDAKAFLWQANDTQQPPKLLKHDGLNNAVFSPDGKFVLTISDARTARLWEVQHGRYLRTLSGHDGAITWAEFSADNQTVLTASTDKTARLWDVASGRRLRSLRGHAEAVTMARFSADGTRVATASEDGTARLWRCLECEDVKLRADKVQQRVQRKLSLDERRRYGLRDADGASE